MLFTCGLWGVREGENEKQEEIEDFDQRHRCKSGLRVRSE